MVTWYVVFLRSFSKERFLKKTVSGILCMDSNYLGSSNK